MSVKTFRFVFEKIIFIFAVIAMTVSVVLIMDTIQSTSDFATAPTSAAITIVISCVLSIIERKLSENPNVQAQGHAAWRVPCSAVLGFKCASSYPQSNFYRQVVVVVADYPD